MIWPKIVCQCIAALRETIKMDRTKTFIAAYKAHPLSSKSIQSWIVSLLTLSSTLNIIPAVFSFGCSSMLLHLNLLVPGFWRLGVQISFFRQFGVAVGKSDYLTLRIGFISVRFMCFFELLGSLVVYACLHAFLWYFVNVECCQFPPLTPCLTSSGADSQAEPHI
jgi:hypothetical protein